MVHEEPERLSWRSGLWRWAAADVDERETLEEKAVVKRLRIFSFDGNSHACRISTGRATLEFLAQRIREVFSKAIQIPAMKRATRFGYFSALLH